MEPMETAVPRQQQESRAWRPVMTVAATIIVITVLMTAGEPLLGERLPDAVAHALSHLFVGVPLGALAYAAARRWPPARATRPGRIARRLVVAGLAGLTAGQLLEVVGARVDEPGAAAVEALAHTAGQVVSMLAMPVLLVGALASLLAAARDGAVSWWVVVGVGVAGAALLTFLVVGAPGGG